MARSGYTGGNIVSILKRERSGVARHLNALLLCDLPGQTPMHNCVKTWGSHLFTVVASPRSRLRSQDLVACIT